MIEWFNSIGEWFHANEGAIAAIFSTLTTGGLGAVVVYVFKNIVATKTNNARVKELAKVIETTEEGTLDTRKTLKNIVANNESLSNSLVNVGSKIGELSDKVVDLIDGVGDKLVGMENTLNAMLDMYTVVYSNLKDENARSTVSNILTNAKYAKTTVKEEVQAQLEALKESISGKMSAMQNEIDGMVKNTEKIIEPASVVTEANEDKGVNRLV